MIKKELTNCYNELKKYEKDIITEYELAEEVDDISAIASNISDYTHGLWQKATEHLLR